MLRSAVAGKCVTPVAVLILPAAVGGKITQPGLEPENRTSTTDGQDKKQINAETWRGQAAAKILECGDMSPFFDNATCPRTPKSSQNGMNFGDSTAKNAEERKEINLTLRPYAFSTSLRLVFHPEMVIGHFGQSKETNRNYRVKSRKRESSRGCNWCIW